MTEILVPIFICVVLPVSIVLLTVAKKMYSDKQRTTIILKAIEANNDIDADKLAESLRKQPRTPLEILNLRLLRGCIFTLVGIGLCVAGLLSYSGGAEVGADPVFIPLILGFASISVGVSYLIVYFVTRKQVDYTKVPESEQI